VDIDARAGARQNRTGGDVSAKPLSLSRDHAGAFVAIGADDEQLAIQPSCGMDG